MSGDAAGLYTKLEAVENPHFTLSKNAFSKALFADVDHYHSPVNIVIGARKFAAGWNSWRVSTMGLMHVGRGEGAADNPDVRPRACASRDTECRSSGTAQLKARARKMGSS